MNIFCHAFAPFNLELAQHKYSIEESRIQAFCNWVRFPVAKVNFPRAVGFEFFGVSKVTPKEVLLIPEFFLQLTFISV